MRRREESPERSATRLFSGLQLALKAWRARGAVTHCYFVRKPPDVRLRFEYSSPEAACELVSWLDARRRDGTISSFTRAGYEPEVALLGGPELLPHVHRYFDADTRAFMEFAKHHGTPILSAPRERSGSAAAEPRPGEARLSAAVLSLAVLNDLFRRAVDGPEEVWDCWWNLASLHGHAAPGDESTLPTIAIDALLGRVPSPDERLLKAYRRANVAFARALRELGARGQLVFGRRSVLPFLALFHWNRYGLSLEARAPLLSAMKRAWDPGRRFHGRLDAPRGP